MTDEAGATPGDTPTSTPMPGIENRSLAEIENLSLLIPYQASAIGVGRDGTGPYVALALVHGDAESAKENGRRIERRIAKTPMLQRWRDSLEEYSFHVEEGVLSVLVRGEGPAFDWQLAFIAMLPF